MGKKGVLLLEGVLLSFPFFPPSWASSPPVLRPRSSLTYRLQVFLLFPLKHLLLSILLPCHVALLLPRHVLGLVNVSAVVSCHAARRHFRSTGKAGETFVELRGTPGLPAVSCVPSHPWLFSLVLVVSSVSALVPSGEQSFRGFP